ncbi:MAG: hypothetical protein WDA09_08845, partial [Bacteriovoracaceae bacterium]
NTCKGDLMKFVYFLTLLGTILGTTETFAQAKYRTLVCGDVEVWTEARAEASCEKNNQGPLKVISGTQWELGQVDTVIRNSNHAMPLIKRAEAETTLFGKKKGFGYYENENFILDLRNTVDIGYKPYGKFYNPIQIWDKNYRGYITCSVSGYHNLSCGRN